MPRTQSSTQLRLMEIKNKRPETEIDRTTQTKRTAAHKSVKSVNNTTPKNRFPNTKPDNYTRQF